MYPILCDAAGFAHTLSSFAAACSPHAYAVHLSCEKHKRQTHQNKIMRGRLVVHDCSERSSHCSVSWAESVDTQKFSTQEYGLTPREDVQRDSHCLWIITFCPVHTLVAAAGCEREV